MGQHISLKRTWFWILKVDNLLLFCCANKMARLQNTILQIYPFRDIKLRNSWQQQLQFCLNYFMHFVVVKYFYTHVQLRGGHFDWFNICSARGNLAYFRLFQRLVDLARFNLDRRRSACCLQLLPWPWTPSRPSHWNISLFLFNNLTEL